MRDQHRPRPGLHMSIIRHVDQQMIGDRVRLDPLMKQRHQGVMIER